MNRIRGPAPCTGPPQFSHIEVTAGLHIAMEPQCTRWSDWNEYRIRLQATLTSPSGGNIRIGLDCGRSRRALHARAACVQQHVSSAAPAA